MASKQKRKSERSEGGAASACRRKNCGEGSACASPTLQEVVAATGRGDFTRLPLCAMRWT
ncbi:hypothetical protein E2562_016167 [Oryza meyeriana var. granulata]|uniref:Uncharacterized protein n=1 Tax=Oryza meyeriana var. granulata TaxID=110450 RepID=A0A6G1F8H5_9ORYZ|nr:hypothetical protein E2562_016167 [Oryza meyeriana var. granulata]